MRERPTVTGPTRTVIIAIQRAILGLARYWFIAANLVSLTILALAFLAPALMAEGYTGAGQAIYRSLAPHDHQLPQRSYFLFGQMGGLQTYSLEQVLAWGADPNNLRAFVGNAEIGFKMALNERMVAIFAALVFGGLVWGLTGGRPRLSPWLFLLLTTPLLLDGFSHMASENSGLGFRQANNWAVQLTGGAFPAAFYTGSTLGSLNWLLRTVTGVLFGLGFVWFLFAYLADNFAAVRRRLEPRFERRSAPADQPEP